MIVALLFTAAFALFATGLGWWPTVRLDRNGALSEAERLATAFGIGAMAVHFGVFFVGPWRLDGVSMGGLALAMAVLALPGLAGMPWRRWRGGLGGLGSLRADPMLALMWLALAGSVAAVLLQGMAPPNDYDSLMYHLSLPRRDVELGRMTPGWEWTVYPFYPSLAEDLFRFGLVLGGEKSVQMLHGLFGISAAVFAAGLARRWGGGRHAQVLAALMFVAVRAVVWEMATCEVDVALASYAAAAVVAYMAWRDKGGLGPALLFGLGIAGAINTKYHGFPLAVGFAPAILWDLAVRRRPFGQLLAGPAVAMVLTVPHMVRDWQFTGNPVFPLFNPLITGGPNILNFADEGGTGRGLVDLVTTPWSMFIAPTLHFDGMVMGAPYLLALMPLAFLARAGMRNPLPALGLLAVYYVEWFYLLSQQVRFLMPVFPVMAALAGLGAMEAWRRVQGQVAAAAGFLLVAGILAANQAMFVGVYAAIRLPSALGLMSAEDYHNRTPTMGGAHYTPCTWVAEHLGPDDRYLSMMAPHFYYCPPAKAVFMFDEERRFAIEGKPLPPIEARDLARMIEDYRIRYVVVQLSSENRVNEAGRPQQLAMSLADDRYGRHFARWQSELPVLARDSTTVVFDAGAILARLKAAEAGH